MSVEKTRLAAIAACLKAIDGIRQQGGDSELSYRTPIQILLNAFCAADRATATLNVLHEGQRQKNSIPDFRVMESSGAILGYVECKHHRRSLAEEIEKEQIKRYTDLSANIILTDGWHWILLRDGKPVAETVLAKSKTSQTELMDLLLTFVTATPQPITNAEQLAQALAARCRRLYEEFVGRIGEDDDSLKGLYEAFNRLIYNDMKQEEFADAFAQTTVYILLFAKLQAEANTQLSIHNVRQHIPHSFSVIRELSKFISELDSPQYSSIKWAVDDILAVINHIDADEIISTLSEAQTAGMTEVDDPFLYFYETFLARYNEMLRKQRGVYYTPLPIVRFIIRAVDDLLKKHFGRNSGLANADVTALDFAAGTGTFLMEMMRRVLDGEGPAARQSLAHEHLFKNFYAFELLIAPYIIAHLKVSRFLEKMGCGLNPDDTDKQLKIVLTNTLEASTDSLIADSLLPALSGETKLANTVKGGEILVIVGNPPYAATSQNTGWFIHGLLRGFRDKKYEKKQLDILRILGSHEPVESYFHIDGQPLKESNPKWLNDDYVKFIRFAHCKMEFASQGIVGIITNNSFLDNATFRGMRASLLTTFDQLYFINLHGSVAKKSKAPDGGKDENVFDIMQSVCISLFVKNADLPRGVYYHDLYGLRQDKYNTCANGTLASVRWEKLQPQAPFYLFVPQDNTLAQKYQQHTSVTDIFQQFGMGLVTSRDKLTIGFNEEEIRLRVKQFLNLPAEEAREKFELGEDAQDWQVVSAQQDLRAGKVLSGVDKLRKVLYRPFDTRYTYYTGKAKGFHAVPRKQTMPHVLNGKNLSLIALRQVKVGDVWQHCLVSDQMVDVSTLSAFTEATSFFPLYRYESALDKSEADKKTENIKPAFRRWLDGFYSEHLPPEDLLGYIYAVLHSPHYRRHYREPLRRDFPRIPFVKDIAVFKQMADIGGRLIAAHLLTDKTLKSPVKLQGDNLTVTSVKYQAPHLFINRSSYFTPIPADVYNFKVGAYKPLEKYLKSRKGRELSLHDQQTIAATAAAIQRTIDLMPTIPSPI